MPRQQHTAPIPYVHPDDPAGYLKPGDTLMAGGYDFAWCYVWFKDIAGKPGYRVGVDGSVWSCWICGNKARVTDSWHQLNPIPDPRTGHLKVGLGSSSPGRSVHVLILNAFVGPCPPGMQCRHFPDRNPANNRLENLHWGTPQQNQDDRIIHGTVLNGEKCSWATLTEAGVIEALEMYRAGKRVSAIARWLGVEKSAIKKILSGETWRHVVDVAGLPSPRPRHECVLKGEETARAILTEKAVLEVLEMRRAGESISSIAQRFKVGTTTIGHILHGETWRHITGLSPKVRD